MNTPNPPHGQPGHACETIKSLVDVTKTTEILDPENMLLATISFPVPNGIELSQVGAMLSGMGDHIVNLSGFTEEGGSPDTDVVTPNMHIASALNIMRLGDPELQSEDDPPYIYEPFTFATIEAPDVEETKVWYALSAAQIAAEEAADKYIAEHGDI